MIPYMCVSVYILYVRIYILCVLVYVRTYTVCTYVQPFFFFHIDNLCKLKSFCLYREYPFLNQVKVSSVSLCISPCHSVAVVEQFLGFEG